MVTPTNHAVMNSAPGQTGLPRPLEGVSVKNSSHSEKNRPSEGRARVAASQDITFPKFGSLADTRACKAVRLICASTENISTMTDARSNPIEPSLYFQNGREIGRAARRKRVCQYVKLS